MKCPVCKTELNTLSICPTCGFSDVRTEFINIDEANLWQETVVKPYRLRHEKASWERFRQSAQIDGTVIKKFLDKSVAEVHIPYGITEIDDNAFQDCRNMRLITIPNSVTRIGSFAFLHCDNLRTIHIPASVTNLEHAAIICDGLDTITVATDNPIYKAENNCCVRKEDSRLLFGCNLGSVSERVKAIAMCAFDCVSKIANVYIPQNVQEISKAAFGGSGIETIEVSPQNPYYVSEGNCCIKKNDNTLVFGCKNSVIPDWVTTIGDYAFSGNNSLLHISIPSSVVTIGEDAFAYCENLRTVTLSAGLKTIKSSAFNRCKLLEKVNIPNTVTTIEKWAFHACDRLSKVILPSSVRTIGMYAFGADDWDIHNSIFCDMLPSSVRVDENWNSNYTVYWRGKWRIDRSGLPIPK